MRKGVGNNNYSASGQSRHGKSSVQNIQESYFKSAREKNAKLKNYFDDEDDNDADEGSSNNRPTSSAPHSSIGEDDDYDPLEAFM
jgi:hypothetical protein